MSEYLTDVMRTRMRGVRGAPEFAEHFGDALGFNAALQQLVQRLAAGRDLDDLLAPLRMWDVGLWAGLLRETDRTYSGPLRQATEAGCRGSGLGCRGEK